MYDFLSFNTFITEDILVVFYYIGAIGFPIALFMSRKYLNKHTLLFQKISLRLNNLYNTLSLSEKLFFGVLLFFFF